MRKDLDSGKLDWSPSSVKIAKHAGEKLESFFTGYQISPS